MQYCDLKRLADERLDDAKALYKANRFDGATYLSGYAIEIALKARICKLLQISDYPVTGIFKSLFATHDFSVLLKLSGLEQEIALSNTQNNQSLFVDWSIATGWQPEMRYTLMHKTKKDVGVLLVSVINIIKWLKTRW
ncbi:MAG: HEPN domain-containing protein [Patescibacteria group bacterium]|jgi:HEPN domain-containing protein